MSAPEGWFADTADDDEDAPSPPYVWRPYLQADGCCFPLPVWFDSEAACDLWINKNLSAMGRRLPT